MGFGSAYALANEVRAGRATVRRAVEWLIRRNHQPPGPSALTDAALAALRAFSLGNEREKIPLPAGVSYRGANAVAAERIIDEFNLRPLIGLEDLRMESRMSPAFTPSNVLGSPYRFRLQLDAPAARALRAKLDERVLPFDHATRTDKWDIYRHGGSARSGLRVGTSVTGGVIVECTGESVCAILEAAGFGSTRPTSNTTVPADSTEGSELALYIDNDAKLWAEVERLFAAFERKRERGTYNEQTAVSLLRSIVDRGARAYMAQYSGSGTHVDNVFSPAVRHQVARDLAQYWSQEYASGNRYGKKAPAAKPGKDKPTAKPKNESFDDDDSDMDMPPECPACGGPGGVLGSLGRRTHYSCRNCGMEFSQQPDEPTPAKGAAKPKNESFLLRSGEAKFNDGSRVDFWFERDRASIIAYDPEGREMGEWWDEGVHEMFTDGFFKGNTNQEVARSVFKYLDSIGVKQGDPSTYLKYTPSSERGEPEGEDDKWEAYNPEEHRAAMRRRRRDISLHRERERVRKMLREPGPGPYGTAGTFGLEHAEDELTKEIERNAKDEPGKSQHNEGARPRASYQQLRTALTPWQESKFYTEAIKPPTGGGIEWNEFTHGVASAFWVNAYADSEENQGRSIGGGADWTDHAPQPPRKAYEAAADLIAALERVNGKSIDELFELAKAAPRKHSWASEVTDEDKERFGWYIGMEALGHGVGWFDDHAEFPLKVPNREIGPLDFDLPYRFEDD